MMQDDGLSGQGISGRSWEGSPRLGIEFWGWGGKCLTDFPGRGKRLYHEGHEGHEGKLTSEGHTGDAARNHGPSLPQSTAQNAFVWATAVFFAAQMVLERHTVEPRRHSGQATLVAGEAL
jgi:hypothetical protein